MTAEFKKCWMLKIYTGEDVIVGNDPLYRTILEEARRLKIAGATVIKGIEGYARPKCVGSTVVRYHFLPVFPTCLFW